MELPIYVHPVTTRIVIVFPHKHWRHIDAMCSTLAGWRVQDLCRNPGTLGLGTLEIAGEWIFPQIR
jgi:hypothetical protein